MRHVLRLYHDQPVRTRLFVRARHALCPMDRIEELVPRQGRVLEVGCGHGLFANLLAAASPARDVLGVDPSPDKIHAATRAGQSLPNVRYQLGYASDVSEQGFDAIAILDVLYLLPPSDKEALLGRCFALLRPGGILVLKTNDTTPRWKYIVAATEEKVMTGVGLTMSEHGLHFYSRDQNAAVLRTVGFDLERLVDLNSWLPYPHVAFVARRG